MPGHQTASASKRALDLSGARIRRTDLSYASLRQANLAGADMSFALLRGADLEGANLKGTILKGADLSDVKNLTEKQLSEAIIDEQTILPGYLRGARRRA